MTPEFIALVKELREAQKKYFKTRMSYDLEHAKKLERQVDEVISKNCIEKENVKQNKLF